MSKILSRLDWSHVQSFLAVAESGSLSSAARRLRLSQPTVGRHIHAMEAAVGRALFLRQRRGMTLTETGESLISPARAMQAAAGQLSLAATGDDDTLAGTVRISASVVMAHNVLPRAIAALRRDAPEIQIELVASDETDNLLFHEADIAVRMYRPDQLDIVTLHVGDVALGVFGARDYLDRAGRPQTVEDLLGHAFVGYDRDDAILRGVRAAGWQVTREWFPLRCDHQTTYWELVRAGCGLGFGQVNTARTDPGLEQVVPGLEIPALPVWLAAHETMRGTPRLRAVWDHLLPVLEALVS